MSKCQDWPPSGQARPPTRAAERVFQRDGIFAARISDIAAKAGVSKAAYYRHFKTKDQVLAAVVEATQSNFEALGAADPAERGLPAVERFRLANRRYPQSYFDNALAFLLE